MDSSELEEMCIIMRKENSTKSVKRGTDRYVHSHRRAIEWNVFAASNPNANRPLIRNDAVFSQYFAELFAKIKTIKINTPSKLPSYIC